MILQEQLKQIYDKAIQVAFIKFGYPTESYTICIENDGNLEVEYDDDEHNTCYQKIEIDELIQDLDVLIEQRLLAETEQARLKKEHDEKIKLAVERANYEREFQMYQKLKLKFEKDNT